VDGQVMFPVDNGQYDRHYLMSVTN
jgi:hypothetical protein